MGPATLDQGDPITLGCPDQGPVQLRKGAMTEASSSPAENTELLEFASLRQQRTGIRHEYESPKLFLWHKE